MKGRKRDICVRVRLRDLVIATNVVRDVEDLSDSESRSLDRLSAVVLKADNRFEKNKEKRNAGASKTPNASV